MNRLLPLCLAPLLLPGCAMFQEGEPNWTLDEVEVPALREDHSYARARDGRGDFERSASPTPGAPNRPGDRSAR